MKPNPTRFLRLFALALLPVLWPAFAVEPQTLELKLGSYYIKPDRITVKLGQPAMLQLTNEATWVPHNLVIRAPEAGMDIQVDVSAGKTASVSFTPTRAGSHQILCSKEPPFGASHKEKGMHGILEVVP